MDQKKRNPQKSYVLTAVILIVCLLSACGSKKAEIIGSWNAVSVQFGETDMDLKTFFGEDENASVTLQIREDGTFHITSFGEEADGTWTYQNGAGTLTIHQADQEITFENGKLSMKMDDIMLTFEKNS